MKLVLSLILFIGLPLLATSQLKLKNAIVLGQFDKPEDRYAIEVNVTEMFATAGVKSMPSLNLLKQGGDVYVLSNDTLQAIMSAQGYDTYVVVNVRGYDKKFRTSSMSLSFQDVLNMTSIYHLYKEEATNVSFEFSFFRENKVVYREIVKVGNVSNRDAVIKKFRKKLPKVIEKKWK
jgi:hypothetical protein